MKGFNILNPFIFLYHSFPESLKTIPLEYFPPV
jgi:hypothetical protein